MLETSFSMKSKIMEKVMENAHFISHIIHITHEHIQLNETVEHFTSHIFYKELHGLNFINSEFQRMSHSLILFSLFSVVLIDKITLKVQPCYPN